MHVDGGPEHTELGDETRRHRDTCLGKEEQREGESQHRRTLAQALVRLDGVTTVAPLTDNGHNRKRAKHNERVGQQVKQRPGHTLGRGGLKADKDEAGVADRTVSEDTLYIGLHDRKNRTDHHGGNRKCPDDRPPVERTGTEGGQQKAEESGEARGFCRSSHEAGDR